MNEVIERGLIEDLRSIEDLEIQMTRNASEIIDKDSFINELKRYWISIGLTNVDLLFRAWGVNKNQKPLDVLTTFWYSATENKILPLFTLKKDLTLGKIIENIENYENVHDEEFDKEVYSDEYKENIICELENVSCFIDIDDKITLQNKEYIDLLRAIPFSMRFSYVDKKYHEYNEDFFENNRIFKLNIYDYYTFTKFAEFDEIVDEYNLIISKDKWLKVNIDDDGVNCFFIEADFEEIEFTDLL